MNQTEPLLLLGSVALVGVLHTAVPDHWVPITLLARQQGWTRRQTAMASLKAGTGHIVFTLILALMVWTAGVAFAQRFGHWIEIVSSLALIGFGAWIALSSWLELRGGGENHHRHGQASPGGQGRGHAHGPDRQRSRTALLLILGSSPMVEGIPAFFAASRYGMGLIAVMSLALAVATIGTYMLFCLYATRGLQRVSLGAWEKYGEVLSGALIAAVGPIFWIWPSLYS